MNEYSTPMMRQYQEIKKEYQDCLLFYRMGDFFELFLEDAIIGSQILSITLTHKSGGKDGKIPMAGIPYHAVDSYIAKLIQAGYKVAICEQLSPPNKRGLVKRDVVRIVTPGTVLDEKTLEGKSNNYIIALDHIEGTIQLALADLSTGYFAVSTLEHDVKNEHLLSELSRLNPSECILPEYVYNNPDFLSTLKTYSNCNIYCFHEWGSFADNAVTFLKDHFKVKTLESFGLEDLNQLKPAAALLGYLKTTQKSQVSHIQKILPAESEDTMLLDKSTMINLELFSTIRDKDTHGSLLSLLDKTQTAMGGRLLKTWIKKPLIDKEKILQRHTAVEELLQNSTLRKSLQEILTQIHDIERVLSRLSVNIGNARDLINLKNSLSQILQVKRLLGQSTSPLLHEVRKMISLKINVAIGLIEQNIVSEPPFDIKNGGIITSGQKKDLDKLRSIIKNSKGWIEELEKKERAITGISTLKIRFNQVFGFYIEISKTNAHLAPKHYMRKQTLVNGERFITPELKEHEEIILNAQEKANAMEYEIFLSILEKTLSFTRYIQNAAEAIAAIDCLSNFAQISETYQYTRPTLLYSGEMRFVEARHPVVERFLGTDSQFVPNDLCLDNVSQSLLLITGPNMAGKSVFIRQVALIVLLCQIGCFVPAKSAHLSLVDKIFVRSGASDMITSGLSTFMVEMVETAYILHNATPHSLIVMDEIGRGTSTYDGISIAWAVAEYLVSHFTSPPKTLFATHYHELQALENEYPYSIKNYHMAVADDKGQPIFLHTLLPGGASHSFGVAVARLAGVPEEVVQKAGDMLRNLEQRNHVTQSTTHTNKSIHKAPSTKHLSETQLDDNTHQSELIPNPHSQIDLLSRFIQKELENLDIANMTPLGALNKLAELKDQLHLMSSEEKKFLEAD